MAPPKESHHYVNLGFLNILLIPHVLAKKSPRLSKPSNGMAKNRKIKGLSKLSFEKWI